MREFLGKSVYKGIALGPVVVLKKQDNLIRRKGIRDIDAEIKRVEDAILTAKEQLKKLYQKAVKEVGEANAAIFEVHQMIDRKSVV